MNVEKSGQVVLGGAHIWPEQCQDYERVAEMGRKVYRCCGTGGFEG